MTQYWNGQEKLLKENQLCTQLQREIEPQARKD